jgi:hypothetical protein
MESCDASRYASLVWYIAINFEYLMFLAIMWPVRSAPGAGPPWVRTSSSFRTRHRYVCN